jgi:hypothetical protein
VHGCVYHSDMGGVVSIVRRRVHQCVLVPSGTMGLDIRVMNLTEDAA